MYKYTFLYCKYTNIYAIIRKYSVFLRIKLYFYAERYLFRIKIG
nr:MAG TPA: hypothetical protein [Caudoviricetes sp.]